MLELSLIVNVVPNGVAPEPTVAFQAALSAS